MAYIETIICRECGKRSQEAIMAGSAEPDRCFSCRMEEINRKRSLHLQGLERLTIEARIKRLEEWIYDYKPPVDPMSVRF